jgi:glutamate carboxypeptidase
VSAVLQLLEELCALDAPTGDAEALAATEELLAARLAGLGAEVVRHPGGHVEGRLGRGERRPALVLCHYDTVWPRGTAAARPLRVAGGVARGPGVFDMRGGIVAALEAVRFLRERRRLRRPVTLLFTADEESGSRTSRGLVVELGRRAAFALVPEPPLPGGRLKSSRRGVLTYELQVRGRAAHAGLEPERGVSAVHELLGLLERVQSIAYPKAGTTVNIGVIGGGTHANVVAAEAFALVDVRVPTEEERERVEAAFAALRPSGEAEVSLVLADERPPMERTPAIAEALERAQALAATLGIDLADGPAGGGSDGSFLAPLGVPVLDGLGPDGGGAHAEDEHVLLASLEQRVRLLALLIERL